MSDLVEFLRARLDEDEQAARDAFSNQADPENGWGAYRPEGQRHTTITPHVGMIHEPVQADHVVRWNPARVLAEVDAKRRMLQPHRHMVRMRGQGRAPAHECQKDNEPWPCSALRLAASVYAEHPDYRQEWRP